MAAPVGMWHELLPGRELDCARVVDKASTVAYCQTVLLPGTQDRGRQTLSLPIPLPARNAWQPVLKEHRTDLQVLLRRHGITLQLSSGGVHEVIKQVQWTNRSVPTAFLHCNTFSSPRYSSCHSPLRQPVVLKEHTKVQLRWLAIKPHHNRI